MAFLKTCGIQFGMVTWLVFHGKGYQVYEATDI